MTSRLALAAALALVSTACVRRVESPPAVATRAPAAQPGEKRSDETLTAPDRTIRFEPIEIRASPEQVAISDLNDEELWAIGQAAMAAGDNAKAALHFERLADFYPESKHRGPALHNSGLMLERMKDYAGAVARFSEAAKLYGETPEGADARFKAADEYFFLGDYDAAIRELEPLGVATYISALKHAEANTKRAVCMFTANRLDDAEKLLRETISEMKDELREEVRDGYLPSQAQFYLAEVYRQHFLAAQLDPEKSTQEELMGQLEYKAQMLLSAQGHYLRCIRIGHPEWATASGYRIGELYQGLYEQLVDAKVPTDLDEEQGKLYKEELRGKIRVLVTKAIDAYEKTLATAERVGAQNPFVHQTREDLERMKKLLTEDEATAKGSEKPSPKSAPDHS